MMCTTRGSGQTQNKQMPFFGLEIVSQLITLLFSVFQGLMTQLPKPGAYEQEHATPLYFCHDISIDRFIFKSNLL